MAKSAQSQKSILIVEDDADIQSLVRRMLALNGYTNYYLAANGEEAIRLLRSNLRPDLIITDRMMPLMDGLEMLREVRCHEELCGIPAIVISALTPESDNAIAALWNDYIVKPLSVQSLLSAVERLIGAP